MAVWLGSKPVLFLAFVVILTALCLRIVYLNHGLPYVYHPDEPNNLRVAQVMVKTSNFNPRKFNYPSLMYYLNLPGQYLVSVIAGELRPTRIQTMGNGITMQPVAYLAARITTLIMGVFVVIAAMLWAAEILSRAWVVTLVGAAVALNPILVRHAAYMTPDTPATLFATLALFGSTLILTREGWWPYLFAGAMAGLAAASKYNVGLVAVAILVAHFQKEGWRFRRITYLAAGALASIASLLVASPYLLLDTASATKGIVAIMTAYRSGHPGHSGNALFFNTVWLFQLIGVAGLALIGLIFVERARLLIPTLIFVLLFFVLLSSQTIRFERNLMPVIPAVLVMVGVGSFGLSQLFMKRLRLESKAAVALTIGTVVLGYYLPLARTWSEIVTYEQDPRRSARLWLAQLVPLTNTLVIESYVPYVREARRKLDRNALLLRRDPSWVSSHDYAVISREGSGRFLSQEYPKQMRAFDELSRIACGKYTFPVGSSQPEYIVFRFSCD